MFKWIQNNRDNALVAAVIASILALIISILGNIVNYYVTSASQNRQAPLEELVRFSQATDKSLAAGQDFIRALNESGDLAAAKEKIGSESTNVALESERIREFYSNKELLDSYLSALQEFRRTTQTTNSVADIGAWVASFDRLVIARNKLLAALNKSLGIS